MSALKTLKDQDPKLYQLIQDNKSIRSVWSETREGEKNLIIDQKPLLANYSAKKEAKKWTSQIEKENTQLIYLYGLGLGYSYLELKSWLDQSKEHYLVYLEDDLEMIQRFLEMPFAQELLENQQVFLLYLTEEKDDWPYIIEDLAYYFVKLPFKISALPFYQKEKFDLFEIIQIQLMHKSAYVSFASLEFLNYGAPVFSNVYHNMLKIKNCHIVDPFLNAFKNVPAIICGAGPSLNKNFSTLQTLKNQALIFAGGSAINALSNQGLLPHFGGSVDPNKEQLKRMESHSAHDTVMFCKGRAFHNAFDAIHGPKIYLSGNTGYPISQWLEENHDLSSEKIPEGNNVLHLTTEIALKMGCNPIIFVGMDLAYTEEEIYASGVVKETKSSKEELTKGSDLNNNAFLREDIHGNPVYTLWKWVAESNYTQEIAKRNPETTFINATEGGIGVKGIVNQKLIDVEKEYLHQQYDLTAKIHLLLEEGRLNQTSSLEMKQSFEEIEASLKSCMSSFDQSYDLFQKMKLAITADDVNLITTLSEEIEQSQEKIEEEIAYTHILKPINHIRSILFERKMEQLGSESEIIEKQEMIEQCDLHRDEIRSLKEASVVNLATLKQALSDFENQGYSFHQ